MSDGGTSYSPSTHPSPAQGRPPPSATQRALGRPTKSGRNASEITKQELEGYFHIPVDVAAARLGVGVTKLKAICRGFGIMRWPYRRIRRLQDLAQRILVVVCAWWGCAHGGGCCHMHVPHTHRTRLLAWKNCRKLQSCCRNTNFPQRHPCGRVLMLIMTHSSTSSQLPCRYVFFGGYVHSCTHKPLDCETTTIPSFPTQVPAVRLAPNPLQQNSLDHASSSQTSTQVGMAPPHVLADQVRMLQGIIAGAPPAAPPAAQNVVNTPPAMFPTLETNEMTASWMLPLLAAMQDAAPQAPQPPPQAPPSQQAPPETSAISLLVEMLRHGATGPQDTILPPEIQQALLSMLFP